MFENIKRIIDEWDPYRLLGECACPPDEYDGETREVAEQITKNSTIDDILTVVIKMFTSYETANYTRDDFLPIAQKIFDAIAEGGEHYKCYIDKNGG